MSLPKELNFASNKPMATSARPQILRFRSDNSTYTVSSSGTDVIRIEIPTGRAGQMLFSNDSFIELKLKINAAGSAAAATCNYQLDQSIYSLFSRIKVSHGSSTMEETFYANRLWTTLYDIQVNENERRGDCITKGIYDTTQAAGGSIYNSGLFGQTLLSKATGVAASDSNTFDFSFVLPSALLGCLAQKAIPLSLLGASSIYLELELAPANVAFVAQRVAAADVAVGVINSYTVSDIYYNAKITVLPQEVESALIQSTGGVINLPAVAYKCELKTMSANTVAFNDKFAFQYSSMKNFLFWVQNSASANGDVSKRSISARPKANISEFYLNINGELFPSSSIQGYCRQYQELMRSYDMLTDTNAGGILTYTNYSNDTATTATDAITFAADASWLYSTPQKRWVGGVDLDRFNRSSDVLMSGTSTIGQQLSLVVNMSAGTAEGLNLYGACMYDVLFHIEGGQLTSKF